MAVDPSVVINIAAEYTGKAAFKQADTATQKLSKGVGKLAKNLGLAFGTTAILAYGKASLRAAAADEKAQQQLALALKNVGLGRDAASSETYIQDLQSEFGIVDDKLRPAYQTLAVATRSSAKAQQLLNLALDISASTGKDLGSVTAALSKAFLGNNASLSKLGVGISKADLKAGKFEDIIAKLTTTFAGSATAAANTFQGSLDKLGVASANVQEIIGTGLIDALSTMGQDGSIDNLAAKMESAALSMADFIRGLGEISSFSTGKESKSILGLLTTPFKRQLSAGPLGAITRIGQTSRIGEGGGFPQGAPREFQAGIDTRAAAASLAADAKARKAAAEAAAKLAASTKKTLKSQQDALKLAKAKAVFDLEKIQIEAALKTKLSEEDKIRLNLMKAIEEENIENADKYQKALEKSQEKTKGLADLLATVMAMQIADPFGQWSIDPLTASINALTNSIGGVGTAITASGVEWSSFTGKVAETVIQPNLKEFSSSFTLAVDGITTSFSTAVTGLSTLATSASKTASDAAAAATATANAALTSTSSTATEAIGSSTTSATDATNTAIASSTVATAVTIVDTSQSAADALDLLYSNATTALTDASAATVTDFMATSSAALADLQAILAEQGAAYAAAVQAASAQAAADAADLAGAGNTKVEITVNAGVIADADQIAEVVQGAIQTINKNGNPLFVAGDD